MMQAIPLLLGALVGLLVGLVAWGFLRARSHRAGAAMTRPRDEALLGLLVLASFALGVFVTYLLLGWAS